MAHKRNATAVNGNGQVYTVPQQPNNNSTVYNNRNIVSVRRLVDDSKVLPPKGQHDTNNDGTLVADPFTDAGGHHQYAHHLRLQGIVTNGSSGNSKMRQRFGGDVVTINIGNAAGNDDHDNEVRCNQSARTNAPSARIYAQDHYRPYTIFDSDNDKLGVLPISASGSLSSIITTSVASSEPDPGGDYQQPHLHRDAATSAAGNDSAAAAGRGGGSGSGSGGDDGDHAQPTADGIDDHNKIVAQRAGGGGGVVQEEWWKTTLQVSIPFFIAGIGTIGAGIILGRVEHLGAMTEEDRGQMSEMEQKHWKVFNSIRELFILVPALLGLKGNLDMCLASRLSTQANLGNMNTAKEVGHMIVGNISLVQVQATVAAFLVALFAISVGAALDGKIVFEHAILLIASSMFTATSSCFVLDFVLVAVILVSHKFKMNPDNLATPLAASIGDVVSLSILSFISSLLYETMAVYYWVPWLMIAGYFIVLPVWVSLVLYNKYTRPVLKSGWIPVLSALFISGMGGLVLDQAVDRFEGFVVFQPIINGIGGNLVSVQASKISTMLHQSSILGIVPPHARICESPWRALFNGVPYAKTATILILMSIPGQIVFIFVADFINMSTSTIGPFFVLAYMTVSMFQICALLYIAHVIIHMMWKWKIDPDNSAIPYLTALGDLFGSSLLAMAFLFLQSIGHPYGGGQQEAIGPSDLNS